MPATYERFLRFLRETARHTPQLYLLGDIFEYWAGDDDLPDPTNAGVVHALRELSDAGTEIYWIAGNRDFLASENFANAAKLTILEDPITVEIADHKLTLTHGDILCTDDHDYMRLRSVLRSPQWQQEFLAKPLVVRKTMIAHMREQSRAAQRGKSYDIMDVNTDTVIQMLERFGTLTLLHGHTHRPGVHQHPSKLGMASRHVLPDWDLDGDHKRGGWISLNQNGMLEHHSAL